jgi:hypothetical protein
MEFLVSFSDTGFGLHYDGDSPTPEFDDIAYWEVKLKELKTKRQTVEREVEAGNALPTN